MGFCLIFGGVLGFEGRDGNVLICVLTLLEVLNTLPGRLQRNGAADNLISAAPRLSKNPY